MLVEINFFGPSATTTTTTAAADMKKESVYRIYSKRIDSGAKALEKEQRVSLLL